MSKGTRRGRPPLGASLVEGVDCSDHARERLRLVLETLSGATTVEDACAELGVCASRFHEMRRRFLGEAAALLEPRVPGPARKTEADMRAQEEIERLRRENEGLRLEAHASRVREELAIAMPGRVRRVGSASRAGGSGGGGGGSGGGGSGGAKKKRRTRRSR